MSYQVCATPLANASIAFCCFTILCSLTNSHAQEFPPAAVIVSEVLQETVSKEIHIVGTLKPRRTSLVSSEFEGRVAKRLKEPGQAVQIGESLVHLKNATLQASLIEGLADVRLRTFDHERNQNLLRQHAISDQQLRKSEYELDRARSKLQMLQTQTENLNVRAPFSGHIVQMFAEMGEWINQGEKIAHVISTDTIRVHVNVPERQIDKLHLGERVTIQVAAISADTLEGRIVAILTEGYPDAHAFPVIVETLNREGRLRSNMAATVTFYIEGSKRNLLVHKDAIVRTVNGTSVFIAVADTAVAFSVQPGQPNGVYVAVSGSINPGDLAIVRGNERLQNGQIVRIIRKLQ